MLSPHRIKVIQKADEIRVEVEHKGWRSFYSFYIREGKLSQGLSGTYSTDHVSSISFHSMIEEEQ